MSLGSERKDDLVFHICSKNQKASHIDKRSEQRFLEGRIRGNLWEGGL